jgi:hypothetical protein
MWIRQLPPSADFKHDWSGKRNLQEALKALKGDALYATLYRFTSSMTHSSDFAAHLELTKPQGIRSGSLVRELEDSRHPPMLLANFFGVRRAGSIKSSDWDFLRCSPAARFASKVVG